MKMLIPCLKSPHRIFWNNLDICCQHTIRSLTQYNIQLPLNLKNRSLDRCQQEAAVVVDTEQEGGRKCNKEDFYNLFLIAIKD